MKTTIDYKKLANIARNCDTKKEIATRLSGENLSECWRIKQLQRARDTARPESSSNPRPLFKWERADCGLKPAAISAAQTWPYARNYRYSFESRIAAGIQKGWTFKYRWHKYCVSVTHGRTVSTANRHAGSGCIDYPFDLTFDLLRQEAVWIGGMLTIRAKSDKGKSSYPCCWFVRRESDPHLHLRKGRIVRRNFHVEDDEPKNERLTAGRIARAIKSTNPPKGWVTRAMSIKAGNCASGTDHFISAKIVPWFEARGITVGDLKGVAIRAKTLMQIETSSFTRRIVGSRICR